jgi:hypothetical protein
MSTFARFAVNPAGGRHKIEVLRFGALVEAGGTLCFNHR